MEMPIDKTIFELEILKKNTFSYMTANQAFTTAIDTMYKYQKIEKLWADFNNGEYDYAPFLRALKLIIESEGVEDGKQ